MIIPARETTTQALDFEFFLLDNVLLTRPTVKVSHIFINFGSLPNSGNVEIFYADDEGEDLIAPITQTYEDEKAQILAEPR